MRFAVNGPNIPDELLVARDEGRVVFFCGAGVSRAKAHLKDFIGLAQSVADKLAIPADKPARQLINAIQTIPPIAGVGSLISADRVFGLIERDFLSRDIYRAIAESLKPEQTPDLTAHRLLLDLAKGPDQSRCFRAANRATASVNMSPNCLSLRTRACLCRRRVKRTAVPILHSTCKNAAAA
jgi:hypothetical protein